MKRQRVGAIIIQNKKILLVRDTQTDFFSIPGGKIENNEEHLSALTREIEEEIAVSAKEAKYYFSFDHTNQVYNEPQTNHIYVVLIDKKPIPSSEIIELGWFSKEELVKKLVKVHTIFYEKILPKLVKEKKI